MGTFYAGVPTWLVDWAAHTVGCRDAVETGTFRGDSAALLAERFGRCTTVELDPTLGRAAAERFAADDSVNVLLGSSRDRLPDVCAALDGPTFFWLDGHWSAGPTAGSDDPCPVLGELDAIAAGHTPGAHVVAIDDARMFGFLQAHTTEPWPSLLDVLARLDALGLATFVLDDVIVGVPTSHVTSFLALRDLPTVRQNVYLAPLWSRIERLATATAHAGRVSNGLRRTMRHAPFQKPRP